MQRHSVAGKGVGQQRESKSLGWATVYTEPDLHRPRTLPSFKQFKKSSGHKAYLLHICNGLSCICHCSMASSQDTPSTVDSLQGFARAYGTGKGERWTCP